MSINKYLEDNSELLEAFKLQLKYFLTMDTNDRPINMVAVCGTEVIDKESTDKTIKDMISKYGYSKNLTQIVDGQRLPYRYTDTQFDLDKLRELLKYKSIKSLSKNDALNISDNIKSKDELEKKIVYIVDDNPSTNSLAIARQFDLEHRNVILKLFELGSMYPSILMKIKPDVYSNTLKGGGDTTKPTSTELELSAEYSALSNTRERYEIFYHIPEDVYYKFVKKIGTPKGLNTNKGMEKLIFIEDIQDAYFNAFTALRKSLNEIGIKKDEIDALIKIRTRATSELRETIYDCVVKNNINTNNKKLDVVNTNKFIFNIINYINDINAINYTPPTEEEIKLNKTRKTKEEVLQEELYAFEKSLNMTLRVTMKFGNPLVETLLVAFDKTEDEVKAILEEYKVSHLWDIMN